MNPLDPERLQAALFGALGAVVYGLYQFGAVVLAGQSPTRADVIRLAANLLCAIGVGLIVSYVLASLLVGLIPWAPLKDTNAIGFFIGVFGWELLPLIYRAAKNRAAREISKQGEGQ